MDIFDVLKAVSKRKLELMHAGVNEYDALMRAGSDVSENYHIPLSDVGRLIGQSYNGIQAPCQAIAPTAVPTAIPVVPVRRE